MSFKKICEEILEPGQDVLKKKFEETEEYAYLSAADNKKDLEALVGLARKNPRFYKPALEKARERRAAELK